jgi:hypothetical protein
MEAVPMATMVGCQACGKTIVVGSTFCSFCGTQQVARAAEPERVGANLGRGLLRIFIGVMVGIAGLVAVMWIFAMATIDSARPSDVDALVAKNPTLAAAQDTSRSAAPASGPATSSSARAWREVRSWEGNGIKDTESFETTSREWRVRWEALDDGGILQIYVHSGDGDLVSLAANRSGAGSDTSYVRSAPGVHYLSINSANTDWRIVAEEPR